MSAKKVSFSDMPHTVEPEQVSMLAGPDGKPRSDLQNIPLRSRTAVDEQFPTADLKKPLPEDALQVEKLELADDKGVTPFGKLVAEDSDFEWLRRKREQDAEASFQQWFASNFDLMTPEQKQMARELFPEFYEQRIRLANQEIDLMKRLARLKIEGIKDKNDLILQYAMESGLIDSNAMENLLHPERARLAQDAAERKKRYGRGLLNSNRLRAGDYGTQERQKNAQGVTGRTLVGNAYKLPFSAYGTIDDRQANFKALFNEQKTNF